MHSMFDGFLCDSAARCNFLWERMWAMVTAFLNWDIARGLIVLTGGIVIGSATVNWLRARLQM
jgi:hypothetical protein